MAAQAIEAEPIVFARAADNAGGLTVSVFSSVEAAEPVWRELETRAVMTPYQSHEWISAYCRAGFERFDAIAILVLSHKGKPIALAPFGVKRRFGVRMAQIIGMPISNCDALVYDPDHADELTAEALKSAFSSLHGSGVDIVSFHSYLAEWQGHANPLLGFKHAPAPNNFYTSTLESGDDPFIDQALPNKRRTNIRRSQRRLTEVLGDVSVRAAQSVEEIERVHAAFLEQRGKRFVQMGVENIFAQTPFQTLFRTLAIASLDQPVPTLRYHALYAGDEIVATSIGACTPTHYSQYINSTTDGPASKYSLMGVMLSALIDELRAKGITSFDMGLGDFDYKTDWTQVTTVYDSVIAVSPLGAIAAPLLLGARKAKRVIKQTPALWTIARAARGLKTRLRSGRGNHTS
jgi:CelD/BcsL family acetyltransferase involved in cellulose biosynthesis